MYWGIYWMSRKTGKEIQGQEQPGGNPCLLTQPLNLHSISFCKFSLDLLHIRICIPNMQQSKPLIEHAFPLASPDP